MLFRSPRALAVGFSHPGHLVYDLDALALRGWWSGAFARQRASGKSWYWEAAGSGLQVLPVGASGVESDVRLQWRDQPSIAATLQHGRAGQVTGYQTSLEELQLRYDLYFTVEGRMVRIPVTEVIRPEVPPDSDSESGIIHREFEVRGVPESVRVLVRTATRADTEGWVVRDILLDQGESDHRGSVAVRVVAPVRPSSEL